MERERRDYEEEGSGFHDIDIQEETATLLGTHDTESSPIEQPLSALGIISKKKSKTPNGDMSAMGNIFALFALYSTRFVVCPWLIQGGKEGVFSVFIPILSPVYRQAEHWQGGLEKVSILAHVLFGAIMLLLGTLQFDKTLRQQNKTLHRWCGRAYVVSGGISLIALNGLRSSFGAGSAPAESRSDSLALFVDLACTLWVGVTLLAVRAAMRRDHSRHRDLMFFSLTLAATPIAQRVMSWTFMTPNAMLLRCLVCAGRTSPTPPSPSHLLASLVATRWGPPGSSSTLLFGSCTPPLEGSPAAATAAADPRSQPQVFSLDGYGEGEQASFAVSAWLALVVVLVVNLPRLWRRWRLGTATTTSSSTSSFSSSTESIKKMQEWQEKDATHLSSLKWATIWRVFLEALVLMVVHKPRAVLAAAPSFGGKCAWPLRGLQVLAIAAVAVCSLTGAVVTLGVMASITLGLSAVYTLGAGVVFFYFMKTFRGL
jgi:hypothetical protein